MMVILAGESQILGTGCARNRELAVKQSNDHCISGHSLLLVQGNFWVETNVADKFDLVERFDILADPEGLSPSGQTARSLFLVN